MVSSTSAPDTQFVEALYRAILGREPDAEGLQVNLGKLQEVGAAQLALDFAHSPEGELRRARAESHGFIATPRPTALGPVRHFISLGTHCYTAALLKTLGLKHASYPFDWLFSSPEIVLDCLDGDFERFMDAAEHRTSRMEDRAEPHINLCDHIGYADDFGVRYVFNHRDPNEPEQRAYYERAIARFRDVLASEDVKLLLMVDSMRGIDRDTFLAISRALRREGRNTILLAIEVVPATNGDMLSLGMTPIAQAGEHRLVRYTSASPIDALAFENPIDDVILRNVVSSFAPAPV